MMLNICFMTIMVLNSVHLSSQLPEGLSVTDNDRKFRKLKLLVKDHAAGK